MATSFNSFVSNAINPAQTIHDNMVPWTLDIWLTEYTLPNPITLIVLLLMIFLVYLISASAMTLTLLLKFGLFFTIAVMTIFLADLIFPSSSRLFFTWLCALLDYAFQTADFMLAFCLFVSV